LDINQYFSLWRCWNAQRARVPANSSMNDDFFASRKGAKAQSFVAYFYKKF
jgi:hypothetical protein